MAMTNQRSIILLSQIYLPAFDEEEKEALTKAIEALTEQEPSVLTLEEAHQYLTNEDPYTNSEKTPVYIECRSQKPWNLRWATVEILSSWLSNSFMREAYGKDWRCWTARPTDEQREATPWQD